MGPQAHEEEIITAADSSLLIVNCSFVCLFVIVIVILELVRQIQLPNLSRDSWRIVVAIIVVAIVVVLIIVPSQ